MRERRSGTQTPYQRLIWKWVSDSRQPLLGILVKSTGTHWRIQWVSASDLERLQRP